MNSNNTKKPATKWFIFALIIFFIAVGLTKIEKAGHQGVFPLDETHYSDAENAGIADILIGRLKAEPFNGVVTVIFFFAIAHSLSVKYFIKKSHEYEHAYDELKEARKISRDFHSIRGGLYHFFGEVEVVFGLWSIVLGIAVAAYFDWHTFVTYINSLSYTEPVFVIVIMIIASSRPIVKLFELIIWKIAKLFGGTLQAWWFSLLILSAISGSFITEPAAMTICAMLLSEKFFVLEPSRALKYATLALLFVNISIGGALTNFASPPILMVAETWQWDTGFMMMQFGWKAVIAIVISTFSYYFIFRREFERLKKPHADLQFKRHVQNQFISQKELELLFEDLEQNIDRRMGFSGELRAFSSILKDNLKEIARRKLSKEEMEAYDVDNAIEEKFDSIAEKQFRRTIPGLLEPEARDQYLDPDWDMRNDHVPYWIMFAHLLFLLWTIINAHDTALFLAGFLFYLGFFQITSYYQNRLDFRGPMLVGFFLAGLIIHGTLQAWWIAPILANLPPLALNLTSIGLTAFNDNAAITYLSTLVPNFPDALKYAVVSGAITGGGLTILANSPNLIGQSLLKPYFRNGVDALSLLKHALLPTVVSAIIFYIF